MFSRDYFARQAATLLKLAQTVKDPILSAVLVGKATDLKEQADEIPPPPDLRARQSLRQYGLASVSSWIALLP